MNVRASCLRWVGQAPGCLAVPSRKVPGSPAPERPPAGRPQRGREYRTERERGRNGPALQAPGWHYAGGTQAGTTTVGAPRASPGRSRLLLAHPVGVPGRHRRGHAVGAEAGLVQRLAGTLAALAVLAAGRHLDQGLDEAHPLALL